jgi:hypothetical protein
LPVLIWAAATCLGKVSEHRGMAAQLAHLRFWCP